MDFEKARANMIQQQIRTWNVLDQRTLDLLFELPREQFVSADQQEMAFADVCLPLPEGECMLTPKVEAHIVQSLQIKDTDRALVIGAGSGYLVALIALLAKKVVAFEISEKIHQMAELNLGKCKNVELKLGCGFSEQIEGEFDVIVASGSTEICPDQWLKSLKDQGRLFMFEQEGSLVKAVLIERNQENLVKQTLFETDVQPLKKPTERTKFVF